MGYHLHLIGVTGILFYCIIIVLFCNCRIELVETAYAVYRNCSTDTDETEQKERRDNVTKFEFYLSEEDTDRLFAVKNSTGNNDLSGNEYAKDLIHASLYKLHPGKVRYDEDGNEIK